MERTAADKVRISLIIDAKGWALDNTAFYMEKYISDNFHVTKHYSTDYETIAELITHTGNDDILHFLFRPFIYIRDYTGRRNDRVEKYLKHTGLSEDEFIKKYYTNKVISTAVCDHLFIDNEQDHINKCFNLVDCYYVTSRKLFDIYSNNKRFPKPNAIITDGVDYSRFFPYKIERLLPENLNRVIRIGWAGNSKWWGFEDLKGINTIIKPAIDELQKEGYKVELITADRKERLIPHKEMPDFFSNIDLYICASLNEGTPLTVLEAMACGVPVISTDVGIVNEAFGEAQREFILKTRSVENLKIAIKKLLNNKELFYRLSMENLSGIHSWDWSAKAKEFMRYCMEAHLAKHKFQP